ncbi:predicted protein, partial [Phaeodactylum tricornutum CCAP 1055/1]
MLLYKHDDDLRQEAFAVQFIRTCDRILKASGLDMKLLTFECIPVGTNRGFVEWVPGSIALTTARFASNPIQEYLRGVAYDKTAPYFVCRDVMDRYIKSCAGYCVITYILGVGDRHLDN